MLARGVRTFVGNYYEESGSTVTKYYYAGSSRIAMRAGSAVYYLLVDQLGSTSITTDTSGAKVAGLRAGSDSFLARTAR